MRGKEFSSGETRHNIFQHRTRAQTGAWPEQWISGLVIDPNPILPIFIFTASQLALRGLIRPVCLLPSSGTITAQLFLHS